MTITNGIYKCEICGNIVEVLSEAKGTLVCCGRPMVNKSEGEKDGVVEKHVPVIEAVDEGVLIKVGEIEHPMVQEHYIQWIEVFTNNQVLRHNLKVGEKPTANFNIKIEDVTGVRAYCNLHGLWKK